MDVGVQVFRFGIVCRSHKLMGEGHWCYKGRGRVKWGFLRVHMQLLIVLSLPFQGLPGSGRSLHPLDSEAESWLQTGRTGVEVSKLNRYVMSLAHHICLRRPLGGMEDKQK